MGRILPAFYQFFDDAGDPLSLGWLRFLEPSTNNTDKNTFADENMSIANANPLRLDAAGRMPDAFGQGKYRVVSYKNDPDDESNPGEQVQVKDPVQAEGSVTGGGSGGFETWDSAITYGLNDIVDYNNLLYRSLIVDNLNNNPAIELYAWEQIDFIRYWNSAITYSSDELVYYTGNLYISIQPANINYNPENRMDYWRPVATGTAAIEFKSDDYEITVGEVFYLFVLSSSTTADKTFTLPPCTSYYDKFTVWIANDSDYNLSITSQLTADIWLEDPVIITKGAIVELRYSGANDHWYASGSGSVLGGQQIGTETNPAIIYAEVLTAADDIVMNLAAGKSFTINVDSTDHWIFDSTGPLLRGSSNPLADIGSSSEYIDDIYCETINIKNLERINFNSSNDLTIFHNTVDTGYFTCNTGNLQITNVDAGGSIVLVTNFGNALVVNDAGETTLFNNLYLEDNDHIYLGASQDIDIYFNGAVGIIEVDSELRLIVTTINRIGFWTNSTERWSVNNIGTLSPITDATYSIGSTTYGVLHIYQSDNCYHYLGSDQDMYFYHNGASGTFRNDTGSLYLWVNSSSILYFATNATIRWQFSSAGHFLPQSPSTYDIGQSSTRVDNIYCNSIDVANGASGTIDTTSSQTITVVDGIITAIV